ncbi:MAG: hypothetical protein NZM25_10125 [Leptospiraceae bacterium]|nr:hypothetical protein [Leptospiraceae bacterium]MDW8307506.1 hypothetical protein [Leptospiraceae bacterium]
MRRLPLLLFLFVARPSTAIEGEITLAADWGRRFADSFNRLWPNLRKNLSETIPAQHEHLELLSEFVHLSAGFSLSPFYRHYFGTGLRYFFVPTTIRQQYILANTTESWDLTLRGFVPFIHYRYYLLPTRKSLFLGVNVGLVFANMDLKLYSSFGEAKANFSQIMGLSLEVGSGYNLEFSDRLSLSFLIVMEIQRLDRIAGRAVAPGIGDFDVELYRVGDYLVPLDLTQGATGNYSKAVLWNNQLRLGVAFLYRVGKISTT